MKKLILLSCAFAAAATRNKDPRHDHQRNKFPALYRRVHHALDALCLYIHDITDPLVLI